MNKRKKGFTLVEILGVIVIIGLLFMISSPNIINNLSKHKDEVSEVQKQSLADSAEEYFKTKDKNYGKLINRTYCVSLRTLQDEGFIATDLINAVNGKKYNLDKTYIVGKAGNNPQLIDYTINENASCDNTFTTCTITEGDKGTVNYIGSKGNYLANKSEFLKECPFSNGVKIYVSPEGWAKEKDVKIIYTGSDLTKFSNNIDGYNIKTAKLDDNITITTAVINKNQTIIASAQRSDQNKIMDTYTENNIDNIAPTCTINVSGEQDNDTKWYRTFPKIIVSGIDNESKISRMYLTNLNNKVIDNKNIKKNSFSYSYILNKNTSDSGEFKGTINDLSGNSSTCKINSLKVDTTIPTLKFSSTSTTRSIKIVVDADALSGIKSYRYSKDGGKTFSDYQKNNTYTFDNLKSDTSFKIIVEVTSNSGLKNTLSKDIKTDKLLKPTFSADGDNIQITYPYNCGGFYTCLYNLNNQGNATTSNKIKNVNTSWNDGNLISTISDGYNSESSSFNYYYTRRNFGYTGSSQQFKTPKNTTYRLEVWGAQGGSMNNLGIVNPEHTAEWTDRKEGGRGGYASGKIYFSSGMSLYVVVGGAGESRTGYSSNEIANKHNEGYRFSRSGTQGGYNGGGNGGNGGILYARNPIYFTGGCGGGGATHIAIVDGQLKDNENRKNSILIVGGGGGGASGLAIGYPQGGGIYGGGYHFGVGQTGQSGLRTNHTVVGSMEGHGGGGGGYYGGTSPQDNTSENSSLPGYGGSSFINDVLSSHTTTEGIETGNGKAKITYLS